MDNDGNGNNQTIGNVDNSVVIQICQYGLANSAGLALRLDRFERLYNKAKRDIDRLNPKTRGFNYIRSPLMDDYEGWLNTEDTVSIRGLIGGAGAGKTRFAIELCDYAAKHAWQAGFIDHDEFLNQHSQKNLSELTWQYTKPTLIVVDYAAGLQQSLKAWLDALTLGKDDTSSNTPPLLILLLERTAHSEFGWWGECFNPNRDDTLELRSWLEHDSDLPDTLPGIEDESKKRELIQSSLKALGSDIQVPPRGADHAFDQALINAKTAGQPLYLIMAAMVASEFLDVDGDPIIGLSAALSFGRTDLADKVAEHEITRLKKASAGNKTLETVLLRLTAVITLMQGIRKNDLPAIAEAEIQAQKLSYSCSSELVSTVVQQLGEEFRSSNTGEWYIPQLQPDIIGEAFILKILGDKSLTTAQVSEILLRAAKIQRYKVADCIFRIVQDYAAHPEKGALGLQLTDTLIEEGAKSADINVLLQLSNALPNTSVTLLQRSVHIAKMLVNAIDVSKSGHDSLRAYGLNNLSVRLSEFGENGEALIAAKEAVKLYRQLSENSPQAFLPGLAISVHNLANRLSGEGQLEEALIAAKEAVKCCRQLFEHSPQVFLPNLAMSLSNLSNRLSDVKQRKKALNAAQEAVMLYRQLFEHSPKTFLPDLAMSVLNFSNRLSEVEQQEQALAAAREAVKFYRQLSEQSPEKYLPYLAMSVHNLSNRLSKGVQRKEALFAAQEAVTIRRQLFEHSPQRFLPDLASSVNNLANRLSEVGRRENALVTAQEAVMFYRQLSEHSPQRFLPDLANSLGMLGDVLSANHEYLAASDAFKEGCYILHPFLEKAKVAFGELSLKLLLAYLKVCEQEKFKPDSKLLKIYEQFFSDLE